MANRKKEVYKPKPMTEGKRNLIQGLLQEYGKRQNARLSLNLILVHT